MQIRLYNPSDKEAWDAYVFKHSDSTHCHLSGWKEVIENTYSHKAYYLIAERSCNSISQDNSINLPREMRSLFNRGSTNPANSNNQFVGILPLIHIKSLFFGNHFVSMPFLNYGGILADDEETEKALWHEAMKIGQQLKVKNIELRHLKPLTISLPPTSSDLPAESLSAEAGTILPPLTEVDPITCSTKTHKVRMLLKLPASSDELFKSYKAKLRSQITCPQKEGMKAVVGGRELLDLFYEVFSINMRDLGSPVHSKRLFKEICDVFNHNARIGIVSYQNIPVAGGMIFCFRDTVEIPWASSLKEFNRFSPNMLLYWSLIEYACDNGFKYFDFGRSTPDEGTYKFKEQWGAKPSPLYWHEIIFDGHKVNEEDSEKSKFETAIHLWKLLPIPFANWIGPVLRKNISL